jgi:hypothetical protein
MCRVSARAIADDTSDAIEQLANVTEPQLQLERMRTSVTKLKSKIAERDQKMKSSKVYNLCRMLWPTADAPSLDDWALVEAELLHFIERCYEKWIEFRDIVRLPADCTLEGTGHMTLYLQAAVRQLSSLIGV